MSQEVVDPGRRTWIGIACGAGAVGTVATAVPFVASFAPSERAKAAERGFTPDEQAEVDQHLAKADDLEVQIKAAEKKGRAILGGVPKSLPALTRAQRMGEAGKLQGGIVAEKMVRRGALAVVAALAAGARAREDGAVPRDGPEGTRRRGDPRARARAPPRRGRLHGRDLHCPLGGGWESSRPPLARTAGKPQNRQSRPQHQRRSGSQSG
mgnify:CR=1 FL=1